MAGYWSELVRTRRSRRAVLAGSASLTGAAAVLAACGGGDGDGGSASQEETRRGLGTLVYDSTKAETPVKRGGIVADREGGDLPSIDPYRQIAGIVQTFAGHVFSRLIKYRAEPGLDPGLAEKDGDAAEKWEIANGGLTYTFKIRPNMKFHNVAPLNGRSLDAEDVVASYERYRDLPAPQYAQSFKGKVDSVVATDKSTVVWKLTKPNAIFLDFVASGQYLWLMGKEAGVSYDTLQEAIGTGPWVLSNYVRGNRWEFKRHEQYWQTGLPYLAGVETYIVPEISQYLAQFQVGTFPFFVPGLAGDMKSLAEGKTDRRIYQNPVPNSTAGVGFGRGDPDSAFLKDVRMRRAVSLAIERDTIIEVINDVDAWLELGLERKIGHPNYCAAALKKWYVEVVRGPTRGGDERRGPVVRV
jgi:ABC-type transport system substrate-binding protein